MLHRRDCLALLGGLLATGAHAQHAHAQDAHVQDAHVQDAHAQDAPRGDVKAGAFGFDRPEGGPLPLAAYAGRPILVVNTATACGYAPQFAGLQGLWTRFGERGLAVIAVPSPDFGDQEPLDGPAIAEAARRNHGVTFPVTNKTHVRGPAAHPFYRWAAERMPGQTPHWNFHKYLVARDGSLRAAFATSVDPTDPRIVSAIAGELGAA